MIDCPHCYVRVLPCTGGTCPACSAVIGDEPPKWVRLSINSEEELPEFCAACLAPTERVYSIKLTRKGKSDYPWWVAILLFPLSPLRMGMAIGEDWANASEATIHLHIRLPLCRSCDGGAGQKEPSHVDFDGGRLTVLVNPEFRALVAVARSG